MKKEEKKTTTIGKNEVVTTFTQNLWVKEYEEKEKKKKTYESKARKMVPPQII